MSTDTTTSGSDYEASATRPKTAPRQQARQVGGPRKVSRYTLDLEANQHHFMKLFALQHNVSGSKVMRTMLYFLESDANFANRVLDEVFAAANPEPSDTEESGDEV